MSRGDHVFFALVGVFSLTLVVLDIAAALDHPTPWVCQPGPLPAKCSPVPSAH
jgi:hypothetical protein